MLKYNYEKITCRNSKGEDKPNEDLVVFDEQLGVGMVLDGVSRDRENGIYPDPSPAETATHLFAETVVRAALKSNLSGIGKIQKIVCQGNKELKKYNDKLQHKFPAGTVGIVFVLENDKIHYGYVGDCYGALIRNGMMRIFTECQTSQVAQHKKNFSSDEIRFDICNHISHPCGYGVWDGNKGAMDFVKYGTISVIQGDVLLIYTDGMEKEIENKEVAYIKNAPLDDLVAGITDKDLDDRTCMRISFEDV